MEKLIKFQDWCDENGIDFGKIFDVYKIDSNAMFDKVDDVFIEANYKNVCHCKYDFNRASDDFFNIYCSDETPYELYGSGNCDTLKAELKKWCHLYLKDKASDIYSKIDDIRDFNNDEIGNISRKLAPIFNVDYSTIYTALTKAKEAFAFESPITHNITFNKKWDKNICHISDFKTVLYINNIKKINEPTEERKFERVLFNINWEFMFYIYFEEYALRNDYVTQVVKDSIIKYFELEYMSKHYSDFAKADYLSSLAKHSVAIFPSSGVRYINSIDQCAWLLSLRVNQALFDLIYKVDKETYYDILNHNIKTNYNNSVKTVL